MDDIDASRLVGRWTHSHEEDEGQRMVFRTSDYPFPPSRGRTTITLSPDGESEVEGPGPDDRTVTRPGHWSLEGNRLTIDAPGWAGTFEVESLEGERFLVRRL